MIEIQPAMNNATKVDAVTLKVGASGLTVKAAPKKISLDDLLNQVTPENLHPATEWGADVGREILPA